MRVEEKRVDIDASWFSLERDVKRTKGLHLSQIIDFIEHRDYSNQDSGDGGLSVVGNAFACGGFLWERVLTNLIERSKWELWDWMFSAAMAEIPNPQVVRPGEQCMDGGECPKCSGKGYTADKSGACTSCHGTGRILIYMTPDGINLDDLDSQGRSLLEEWKDTSKSIAPITDKKFDRWVRYQIPAYLKAMRLRTCRLRVRFNHGNYRDERNPIWCEYVLSYCQQEIDETWELICNNARTMVEQGLA